MIQLQFRKIVFGCFMMLFFLTSYGQHTWDTEAKKAHETNRRDSTTWDQKLFKMDVDLYNELNVFEGVFPVPNYHLAGKNSFVGVGYSGDFVGFKSNDKLFLYNCFFARKNKFNSQYIPNVEQDVFFVIAISTDFIDQQNYTHFRSMVSSRNHPNYLAQGFYKTKNNKIDYKAFITGDRDAYAIVNERIFDLEIGKMIFIVPQKDASLRSMQIDIPRLSIDETKEYIEKLLKTDKEIIHFYKSNGSI